ncbi:DUF4360 domain-containing protein [Actinomadura sp. KC06]|nr:DUF4360 domain-containing protein [Actinomadura sp. KC06]
MPAAPAAASAGRPVPGPDGVTIEIANISGSGCPPGTAEVVVADDNETFTIGYSDFTARVGGASQPADARKLCQLSLKVNSPGFTYAISQTDYRISADLRPGAKAVQKSSHHLQSPPARITTLDLVGPQNGDFQTTDRIPPDQLVWKRCGLERNLGVGAELRADTGTSDPSEVSSISMNAADGDRATYHFAWKQCT